MLNKNIQSASYAEAFLWFFNFISYLTSVQMYSFSPVHHEEACQKVCLSLAGRWCGWSHWLLAGLPGWLCTVCWDRPSGWTSTSIRYNQCIYVHLRNHVIETIWFLWKWVSGFHLISLTCRHVIWFQTTVRMWKCAWQKHQRGNISLW